MDAPYLRFGGLVSTTVYRNPLYASSFIGQWEWPRALVALPPVFVPPAGIPAEPGHPIYMNPYLEFFAPYLTGETGEAAPTVAEVPESIDAWFSFAGFDGATVAEGAARYSEFGIYAAGPYGDGVIARAGVTAVVVGSESGGLTVGGVPGLGVGGDVATVTVPASPNGGLLTVSVSGSCVMNVGSPAAGGGAPSTVIAGAGSSGSLRGPDR